MRPPAAPRPPAAGPRHLKTDDRLAVEQRELRSFGSRIVNRRDLVEPQVLAAGQCDVDRAELLGAIDDRERAQGLFRVADFRTAARCLQLHALELARHVRDGEVERGELRRVELDSHLTIDATEA